MIGGAAALLVSLWVAAPQVEASVFAARPAVMSTGQLLGPAVRAGWTLGAVNFGLLTQLGWANEDDRAYQVQHRELRALGDVRWSYALGRGDLSVGVGAGVVHLHETRSRHQAERLSASGLSAEETGSTFGVVLAAEAGLNLSLVDPLGLVVGAGPNWSWLADTEGGWRLGWSAHLGLRVHFGGTDG